MNILAMFVLIALALLLWWLMLQKLRAKPWLTPGIAVDGGASFDATRQSPKLIALGVFLAVITALFALFAAAYHMRMAVPDWTHLPLPEILRVNTLLLAASSGALQWAWSGANGNGDDSAGLRTVRRGLMVALCLAIAFLAGQWMAWEQLDASGFYFSCTPASAFFYLLSGLHALHLAGGLVVLAKTIHTVDRIPLSLHTKAVPVLSIKLCALYWHYLLALWLALYALLAFT